KSIKTLIKKHFFSDIPDVNDDFQYIHDYSDTEKNEFNALVNNLKPSYKESIKRINTEYNLYRNKINDIKIIIKSAEANMEDPVVTYLREKKGTYEIKIEENSSSISNYNQESGALSNSIVQHKKRIEEISKKIEISQKNKDKDETARRLIDEL